MRRHERESRVEHADAAPLEHPELPEAGLDPGEVVADVQTRERHVAARELHDRVVRREHAGVEPLRAARAHEPVGRRRLPVCEQRDLRRTAPHRPESVVRIPRQWVTGR